MADKTVMILRNDPAKNRKKLGMDRKKLGKVKDLFEQMEDDFNDFDSFIDHVFKNKGRGN